jgi:hypothetical protein
MVDITWKPWHQMVELRADLRSGELTLHQFAADLYHVHMGEGQSVYRDPSEFFALTYPTHNLRSLARDVVLRLAKRGDKAVRQLVLTYGGGKTHSLLTLYHLVHDPAALPDPALVPAVGEFRSHIGFAPPRARTVVMAFDRLDPVQGMLVPAPDGATRQLRLPWSVLAYQLGGEEGLRILGNEGDSERETPPFTNVIEDLLKHSAQSIPATLILMDEVLMWARTKAGENFVWRDRMVDFCQHLTQAVSAVPGCALVASLLASDPRRSDNLGREILQELSAIFRREEEEPIEPVAKEDVAEVLFRRLFTPDSMANRDRFRPQVTAALRGISALDEQTAREGAVAEERYLKSYPFHPELTEVLYAKWTNFSGFQRTRGVLRTFALALRDAQAWDDAPLIGPNVFLAAPGANGLSPSAQELSGIASSESYEGRRQEWSAILQGELAKARTIQADLPSVQHRELEQAVMATFLHSQPMPHHAATRELLSLVGHTAPDRIEMEQALLRWADISWFLDDKALIEAQAAPNGVRQLPATWRLGYEPNLVQIHHVACQEVLDQVEGDLKARIRQQRDLTAGASGSGARVHTLPDQPSDVGDDGEFHFAVLGPAAASAPGDPSALARRFLTETTAADRPRVFRNAVVLVTPSRDGLAAIRGAVRDALGWLRVDETLRAQGLDPTRAAALARFKEQADERIPATIRQAYCMVVTYGESGAMEAFRINLVQDKTHFQCIKADVRTRIEETAINDEALLPEGPHDLWREGETSRRIKDLVSAFAQYPRLPKMLSRQAIYDTLALGCEAGTYVLRLTRPDHSTRTFWLARPDEDILKDDGMDLVLPAGATLDNLDAALLAPEKLPGLWSPDELHYADLVAYFSGGRTVTCPPTPERTYSITMTVPTVPESVIQAALRAAVANGSLWLRASSLSLCHEPVPDDPAWAHVTLAAPPARIEPLDLLPLRLPNAWRGEQTDALAIHHAVSQSQGHLLPWPVVRQAIVEALFASHIERAPNSGAWPCEADEAQNARFQVPSAIIDATPVIHDTGRLAAESDLSVAELQDLADAIGDLQAAVAGHELVLHLRIQVGGDVRPLPDVVARLNDVLHRVNVRLTLR